jgi:hypothetical protein
MPWAASRRRFCWWLEFLVIINGPSPVGRSRERYVERAACSTDRNRYSGA